MPRPPAPPSPPPASFSFTAGSFDYPQASLSPPPSSARSRGNGSISRALRSLADRPERPSPAHDVASASRPPPMARRVPRSARRGPMHRLFGPPRDSDDSHSRRPPTANPNRPRAQPSERYLSRSSERIREARADMESAADLLDSLSDIPINNPFLISASSARPRSPTVDVGRDRRQAKRRKLDHSASPKPEYDGFKYGHKGQVVPGRLRMEVLSCDGGEYYDKDYPIGLHSVQNVLKNDSSVYCSHSSRCNLLLKHSGDTPFALEKIVIRAPNRGFTAPVQEGLIFVSMDSDELLSNTAGYDLHYSSLAPVLSPSPSPPPDDDQLSLREAMEDPHVWRVSRQGPHEEMQERIENLRLRTARLNQESSLRSERDRYRSHMLAALDDADMYGDNCDNTADDSYAGTVRISAPTPPPFTVTAATEEEDTDSNEEMPSAAVMADRLRRESRWRADSDEEEQEEYVPLRFDGLRRTPSLRYNTYDEWRDARDQRTEPIRANRTGTMSRIELPEQPESETLLAPHARFFIAKKKSKLTIKFHPAISGKHVLLKLWSPTHNGNIDIQSVQFYGFSGPRFFPAVQAC